MPVIALQGLRGGMGTTSVTAALARALQQLGESVLAIDFTPDNLLRLHFNTPFELARGWARAERDGGRWQEGALRYCENLDFLPFGRLNAAERLEVQRQCQQQPERWRDNVRQLIAGDPQRWILLDVPVGDGVLAQQALQLADSVFVLLNPDANCRYGSISRRCRTTAVSGQSLLLRQPAAAGSASAVAANVERPVAGGDPSRRSVGGSAGGQAAVGRVPPRESGGG